MESFYIAFEADTKSLNKGIDDSDAKTKKLTENLHLADKTASGVGTSMVGLVTAIGGTLLALGGFNVIQTSISQAIEYGARLGDLNNVLDISVEQLDAWGKAVTLNGGHAEDFFGTIQTMSSDLAMIHTKGTSRMLPFWKDLNIQLKDAKGNMRPIMDLLPDLADKFEKMGKQESLGMGKKLGLDMGTITTLQQGRRAVEDQLKQMKEFGVFTKEQTDALGKLDDMIDQTKFKMQSWGASIVANALPAFERFSSFIEDHSDGIKDALAAIAGVITVLLLPSIMAATGTLLGMAAAVLVATWPFLLIGAAILLVADDIEMFLAGHDSMIGRILKDYPIIMKTINWVKNTFKEFLDIVNAVIDAFKSFSNMKINLGSLISGGVVDVAHTVMGLANGNPLNSVNSSTMQSMRTANSNVTVGKVVVNTQATDAEGISKSVGYTLKDHIMRANSNFDDGMMI